LWTSSLQNSSAPSFVPLFWDEILSSKFSSHAPNNCEYLEM
jgi:hypothetical protein